MELVHKPGRMSRRTSRLALGMTLPTVITVLAIVIFPLLATFWISVKPIELSDLRPVEASGREKFDRTEFAEFGEPGDEIELEWFIKNSSREFGITNVEMTDVVPAGIEVVSIDERCTITGEIIRCDLGDYEPAFKESLFMTVRALENFSKEEFDPKGSKPVLTGRASNPLVSQPFTLENFVKVFNTRDFTTILITTFVYTIGSTAGALLFGLFASLLLNSTFPGRGVFRGMMLVPYVAPVIAVAFTWLALLDPTSGALNALLVQMGAIEAPINFFGIRSAEFEILGLKMGFPVALATVIGFEAWRYFPLAFLFILARMQSIPQDMYEAADMDGASPFQKFWALTIQQLIGVMSVLFLLRFIWTFNKFDDIFLLTGGNAGTQTLTVEVYKQAFAISNLGAGAAVAVVIFFILAAFSVIYFLSLPKDEGL